MAWVGWVSAALGDRLTVGPLGLNQVMEVRALLPELVPRRLESAPPWETADRPRRLGTPPTRWLKKLGPGRGPGPSHALKRAAFSHARRSPFAPTQPALTVRTGQDAVRRTCSATLPSTSRRSPVRPSVPMTIRSHF